MEQSWERCCLESVFGEDGGAACRLMWYVWYVRYSSCSPGASGAAFKPMLFSLAELRSRVESGFPTAVFPRAPWPRVNGKSRMRRRGWSWRGVLT